MRADFGRTTDVAARVCSTKEVAQAMYVTRLETADATRARPGQFVQLRVAQDISPWLRIPLSVCAVDARSATVDVLYEDVGPKTHLLSQLPVGSCVSCMGPLGNAFPEPGTSAAILVGGGIGLPPLMFHGQRILEGDSTAPVYLLAGARTASKHLPDSLLESSASTIAQATADGTLGHHGLVTDLLLEKLDGVEDAVVYTCGPHSMMAAVAAVCRDRHVTCHASLEEYMACGFGVCVGCVVELEQSAGALAGGSSPYYRYSRICVDGPVYDAADIKWT